MMARPIRIEGDIAYVPLTKGYEAVIDAADVPLVDGVNWVASVDRRTVYACRHDKSGPTPRFVRMHRALMGDPIGLEVDHCDSNGLNNRRANLRLATRLQNAWNQRRSSLNTSGLKGAVFYKQRGKWRSMIKENGKNKHLGYFATAEEAHIAYAKASAELRGEFGRID